MTRWYSGVIFSVHADMITSCGHMFQVFCSHLEHLIQQLYTVSEKMELLAARTVNIDSVKSSLAEYQVGTGPSK